MSDRFPIAPIRSSTRTRPDNMKATRQFRGFVGSDHAQAPAPVDYGSYPTGPFGEGQGLSYMGVDPIVNPDLLDNPTSVDQGFSNYIINGQVSPSVLSDAPVVPPVVPSAEAPNLADASIADPNLRAARSNENARGTFIPGPQELMAMAQQQQLGQPQIDPSLMNPLTGTFQGLTGDGASMAMQDPNLLLQLYGDINGINPNSGQMAMAAQSAKSMPTEWFMTEAANDPSSGMQDEMNFYEQNIQQGMTPGAMYYGPQDFNSQAFQERSAMNDYIFSDVDQEGNPQGPDAQMSNFLTAMEAVLGGTTSPEHLQMMQSRYMQSYREYTLASAQGQAPNVGLDDWFTMNGLGLPGGGN